jgi:hypothetical protein
MINTKVRASNQNKSITIIVAFLFNWLLKESNRAWDKGSNTIPILVLFSFISIKESDSSSTDKDALLSGYKRVSGNMLLLTIPYNHNRGEECLLASSK